MIKRYSTQDMAEIWSDQNKYQKWLDVEIAVCEAWAVEGVNSGWYDNVPLDVWYDEETLNWVKATFTKKGQWEYRLVLIK